MTGNLIRLGLAAAFVISAYTALAEEPAAIVESVSPGVAGVEFMAYLRPGQTFTLGPTQTATLGYLQSCIKESITGGGVKVGFSKSTVTGGKVQRTRVRCDGGNIILTSAQAEGAVTAFRARPRKSKSKNKIKPQLTIYATNPIVTLIRKTNSITIERLDKNNFKRSVKVKSLVVDLAKHAIVFEAGGVYRLAADDRKIIFKVNAQAGSSSDSILQRLIRL